MTDSYVEQVEEALERATKLRAETYALLEEQRVLLAQLAKQPGNRRMVKEGEARRLASLESIQRRDQESMQHLISIAEQFGILLPDNAGFEERSRMIARALDMLKARH